MSKPQKEFSTFLKGFKALPFHRPTRTHTHIYLFTGLHTHTHTHTSTFSDAHTHTHTRTQIGDIFKLGFCTHLFILSENVVTIHSYHITYVTYCGIFLTKLLWLIVAVSDTR